MFDRRCLRRLVGWLDNSFCVLVVAGRGGTRCGTDDVDSARPPPPAPRTAYVHVDRAPLLWRCPAPFVAFLEYIFCFFCFCFVLFCSVCLFLFFSPSDNLAFCLKLLLCAQRVHAWVTTRPVVGRTSQKNGWTDRQTGRQAKRTESSVIKIPGRYFWRPTNFVSHYLVHGTAFGARYDTVRRFGAYMAFCACHAGMQDAMSSCSSRPLPTAVCSRLEVV